MLEWGDDVENILSKWMTDIVMVSLLSAVASALCENMTSAKKAIPLITTSALLIVTILSFGGHNIDDLIYKMDHYSKEYTVNTYVSDELTRKVTMERLSEYAERRMRENEVDGNAFVEVELTMDGYYAPSCVKISGAVSSESEKKYISEMLKKELSCDELYWDGERQ